MTDIRYTLAEAWRIVSGRRWFFVLPFGAVTTIAFVCSLWVPRTFTAATVIKRENDPVLASLMGRTWTGSYDEMRKHMASDLADPDLIGRVLDELDLPPGSDPTSDRAHAPDIVRRRSELETRIKEGLSLRLIESSSHRDIVSIELSLENPQWVPAIVNALRDHYIDQTRKKSVRVLEGVRSFFLAESQRCRSELGGLQESLAELEVRYPGIDPDTKDPTQAEQSALLVERLDLVRQRGEWLDEQARLHDLLNGCDGEDERAAAADDPEDLEPNPRYVQLHDEIRALQKEIKDNRLLRMMTDRHPKVVSLRQEIAIRRAELESLPRWVTRGASGLLADGSEELAGRQIRTEFQLTRTGALIAGADARLATIADRIAEIERIRFDTANQREAYLNLRQRSDRLREELDTWQANIGPINRILTVEDNNRAIHFTKVQAAGDPGQPSAPVALTVLLICLAIGAAAGSLSVLGCELGDRSFRTVKQLHTSLGIPVIESINEILTEPARRKWLMRHLLLLPATAALLFACMTVSGFFAYLSLNDPALYETLKASPLSAAEILMEQS
jgi:hypothetical protein